MFTQHGSHLPTLAKSALVLETRTLDAVQRPAHTPASQFVQVVPNQASFMTLKDAAPATSVTVSHRSLTVHCVRILT